MADAIFQDGHKISHSTYFFLQYDISTAHFERCSSHPLNQARPVTVMEVILFDL